MDGPGVGPDAFVDGFVDVLVLFCTSPLGVGLFIFVVVGGVNLLLERSVDWTVDISVDFCVGVLAAVLVPGGVVDSFVDAVIDGVNVDVFCIVLVTFSVNVVDSCMKDFVVGLVSFEVFVHLSVRDNAAEVVFTVVAFDSFVDIFI